MELISSNWHAWMWSICTLAIAILIAAAIHTVLFLVLKRLARRKGDVFISSLVRHGQAPSRRILPLLTLLAALPVARLPENVQVGIERAAGLGLIAATAWLVILTLQIVSDLVSARYRMDLADNLSARRMQTQIEVLHRIVVVVVVIVTVSIMLMTFPAIKHIGMSLLASGGGRIRPDRGDRHHLCNGADLGFGICEGWCFHFLTPSNNLFRIGHGVARTCWAASFSTWITPCPSRKFLRS